MYTVYYNFWDSAAVSVIRNHEGIKQKQMQLKLKIINRQWWN